MTDIEVIDTFDTFCGLENVWNELLSKSDIDIPFMTFEYLCFWWKLYGSAQQPLILVVKDAGAIVAVAPLMRKKIIWRGLPVTAITFLANYHSMRTGLIVAHEKENLFTLIFDYVRQHYLFDMFSFDLFIKNTATDRLLRAALGTTHMKYVAMQGELSPYIAVAGDWAAYEESRSKKFLKNIKYRNNLFARDGGYEITDFSGEHIEESLQMVMQVSQKTAQYAQKTAIVNSSDSTTYHTALARMAAQSGWLRISGLRHKGVFIAFEFKLLYKKTVYLLKVGFDTAYARFAPGTILLRHSIQGSFSEKYQEFNFLGKNEPHKMEWTSSLRENQKYWIFNDTAYGRFLCFWEMNVVAEIKRLFTRFKSLAGNYPAAAGEKFHDKRDNSCL